ncbi:MAG TPA: hypothetical protein EYP40_01565 [Chromatiales bacterium]|nr:hypothetical protein [Chromatiales bacterium]
MVFPWKLFPLETFPLKINSFGNYEEHDTRKLGVGKWASGREGLLSLLGKLPERELDTYHHFE